MIVKCSSCRAACERGPYPCFAAALSSAFLRFETYLPLPSSLTCAKGTHRVARVGSGVFDVDHCFWRAFGRWRRVIHLLVANASLALHGNPEIVLSVLSTKFLLSVK